MTINEKINSRKTGSFARWANARKLFAKVKSATDKGMTVYFSTYTTSTKINAKHIAAGMLKVGRDGLYVQRGKNWDFLGGCKVTAV